MICGSSTNVSEKPCGYVPLKGDPKLAWMTIERHQKMKESYQSDGSMNQFLLDKHMYYLFWVGLFSGRIIHRKKWLDELMAAAARSFHKFVTVSQRWNVWPEPFSTKIWCMLNTQAILPFNIDASVRKKSRTQFSLGSSRSPFRSVEKPTGLDAFAGAGWHDADSLWTLQEGPPVTGGHRELGSLEMEGSRSSGESQIYGRILGVSSKPCLMKLEGTIRNRGTWNILKHVGVSIEKIRAWAMKSGKGCVWTCKPTFL